MDIFIRSILVSIFLLSLSCNPQNTAENDISDYSNIEMKILNQNEIDLINSSISKFSFLALR